MHAETDSLISSHPKSVPEIIDNLGFGRFQWLLLTINALINIVFAIECFMVGLLIYILDKNWDLSDTAVSVHNGCILLSMALGCLASGILEDRLTRWGLTKLSLIIIIIFSIVSSCCPEIISFTISRMIVLFGTFLSLSPAFSCLCEMLPTKGRGFGIAMCEASGIIGYILVTAYSYFFISDLEGENWRLMSSIIPIPLCIVALGLCIYLIDESPVYCAKRNMHTLAVKGLGTIAKVNSKPKLTVEEIDSVMSWKMEIQHTFKFLDLFDKSLRKQTLLLLVVYTVTNSGYYGVLGVYLYLLDQEDSEDFIFLNFVILVGCQIPGMISYVLLIDSKHVGRKRSLQIFTTLALLGISLPVLYYDDITIIIGASVYEAYKFVLIDCLLLYTAELYETELRNSALAYLNVISRLVVIGVPYAMLAIISLGNILAFGFLAILELVGLICISLLTQETQGMVLDSIIK